MGRRGVDSAVILATNEIEPNFTNLCLLLIFLFFI